MATLYKLLETASSGETAKLSQSQVDSLDEQISSLLMNTSEWATDPLEFSQLIGLFKRPGYVKSFEAVYSGFKSAMISIPNVFIKGEDYIDDFFLNVLPYSVLFSVSYADSLMNLFDTKKVISRAKTSITKSYTENAIPAFAKYGELLLDDEQFRLAFVGQVAPKYASIDYASEASHLGSELPRLQLFIEEVICEDYRLTHDSHQIPPSKEGAQWLINRVGVEKLLNLYDSIITSNAKSKGMQGEHINEQIKVWREKNLSSAYSAGLLNTLRLLDPKRLKERYPALNGKVIVTLSEMDSDPVYFKALIKSFPEQKRSLLTRSLDM